MMTQKDEKYLTANEACSMLNITRKTLDRYVERGLLHKYRRGLRSVMFKQSELNQLAEHLSEIRPYEDQE